MEEEKKAGLEQSFATVEETLKRLEDPDLPLEQAFALYEEGIKTLKSCNEEIDRVEKKVLLLKENGETDEF